MSNQVIGILGLIFDVIGIIIALLTILSQTSLTSTLPILALLAIGFLLLLIYFININRGFNYTREFYRLEIARIEAELLDSPEYYNALWRGIYYQASLDGKKDLLQALEEKGQLTKNRAI